MNITDEDLEKWVNDSIRYAVESIDAVAIKHNLNPYNEDDYGKFYKLLHGKVDVDVRTLSMLLRNWIFMKYKYQAEFRKPRIVLLKNKKSG